MKWIRLSNDVTESSDGCYRVCRVNHDRSRTYEAWEMFVDFGVDQIVGADYETAVEAQQACEAHARACLVPGEKGKAAK